MFGGVCISFYGCGGNGFCRVFLGLFCFCLVSGVGGIKEILYVKSGIEKVIVLLLYIF